MKTNSDTPRVDAVLGERHHLKKLTALALNLERELSAAQRRIAYLESQLEEWHDDEEDDEPRMLEHGEVERMQRMAAFLLELTGAAVVAGVRSRLEAWAADCSIATEEDADCLQAIFDGREREAHLRGEPWAWEAAA